MAGAHLLQTGYWAPSDRLPVHMLGKPGVIVILRASTPPPLQLQSDLGASRLRCSCLGPPCISHGGVLPLGCALSPQAACPVLVPIQSCWLLCRCLSKGGGLGGILVRGVAST